MAITSPDDGWLFRLNLPAGVLVFLTVLFNWQAGPNKWDSSSLDSSSSLTTNPAPAVDPFLPVHDGLVRFPAGSWDDPYKFQREAQTALLKDQQSNNGQKSAANHAEQEPNSDFRKNFSRFFNCQGTARLLVLPVVVRGGNDASSRKARIDSRHAVANALALSRFRLKSSELAYTLVSDLKVDLNGQETSLNACVPVNLYSGKIDTCAGDVELGVLVM